MNKLKLLVISAGFTLLVSSAWASSEIEQEHDQQEIVIEKVLEVLEQIADKQEVSADPVAIIDPQVSENSWIFSFIVAAGMVLTGVLLGTVGDFEVNLPLED